MGVAQDISSAVYWDAPSIEIRDTLRKAMATIAESAVSALIVKSGGQVIGLVTDMDLMRCVASGEDFDGVTVSSFMTSCEIISDREIKTPCVQLDETKSVRNAIGVMDLAGIHHLLVTGEKGAGIATAHDLLRLAVS